MVPADLQTFNGHTKHCGSSWDDLTGYRLLLEFILVPLQDKTHVLERSRRTILAVLKAISLAHTCCSSVFDELRYLWREQQVVPGVDETLYDALSKQSSIHRLRHH